MFKNRFLLSAALALLGTVPIFAAPSFHPDVTFTGSSLSSWHTLGQASWRAENGEITGTPQSADGGWLMLDKSYQDVGLYAEFRCTGGCNAGALFRVKKTADGWEGIYVSLTEPQNPSYKVTLDTQGKIITRERLRPGGGLIRVAPPPNPNRPPFHFHFPHYNVTLPLVPPDTSLRPNEWNSVEFLFDANIIRTVLNHGRQTGGVADEGYGPFALYVGGTGQVQFRNVAYKDLGLKYSAPCKTSPDFREQRISQFYYSMTAAVADFNHDGHPDIVAGPYIYYGPDYTKRSEIALAQTTSPGVTFNDWWVEYAADFTGDGWPDVVNVTYGGRNSGIYLYVNPEGANRRWKVYKVVSPVQSEIAVMADIDGSGKPAIVYMGDGYVSYAEPNPADPTGKWIVHHVSQQGYGIAHGIGVGDINGDGLPDIVNVYGWWQHPPKGSNGPWTYHPQVFGRYDRGIAGGATMGVYDVNGDGLADVVTALDAHGWGLAWFEQKRDAQGNISFVRHFILNRPGFPKENSGGVLFSEPHAATFADMNGDGIPDFIVGKRYWSHNADYLDPYPFGPPVLYWYKTVRDKSAPGGAKFVPELVNNCSGVGSTVLTTDLNHDGALDMVSSNKLGTFIFWGKPGAIKK